VSELLQSILTNDEPIPAGLPQIAIDYFESTAPLPSWADPANPPRAGSSTTTACTSRSASSARPAQAYAAANGAEVLVQTGAMLDRVRQRIFETAQFLFDVLDVGSLDTKGRGVRSAQRVRLMHAAIRHLIAHHPRFTFDPSVFGQPINQEDKAGTLMTFSIVTIEAAQRLGVTITREDADAWVHHWGVVGHLIGLEDELIPRDAADAAHIMEAIRERQWAPSPRGRQLTHALVDMMQEFFTRDVDALDGLTPSLVRHLAGDRCAGLHDLPRSDWTMLLIRALEAATEAIDDEDRSAARSRARRDRLRSMR
jgi:hypothetical protein